MKTINKFNLKNGLLAAAIMILGTTACTNHFEELNTDPTGLTSSEASKSAPSCGKRSVPSITIKRTETGNIS